MRKDKPVVRQNERTREIVTGGERPANLVVTLEEVFGDFGVPFAVHVEEADNLAVAENTSGANVYKHAVFLYYLIRVGITKLMNMEFLFSSSPELLFA